MHAYAQLAMQDAEIAAGKDPLSPQLAPVSPPLAKDPLSPPRAVRCRITEVTPAVCCRPLLFHIETALPNGTVCDVSHRFKHFKQLYAYISKLGTPWAARVVRENSLPSGGFRLCLFMFIHVYSNSKLERLFLISNFF